MVAGHLEVKKGYYYAVLSYLDVNGHDTPLSVKRRRGKYAYHGAYGYYRRIGGMVGIPRKAKDSGAPKVRK